MSWIGRWKRIEDVAGEYLMAMEKEKNPHNIAALLDVSPSKIKKWASGKAPDFDELVLIAEKLGLSPRWLLFGEGDPQDL